MKLAGAAWAYVGASLPESAAILQALGVQAMDLIAAPGALLDSREIERDPQGQARRVTEAGLPISNLLYVFGDRPLNSVDDTVRAANLETFERVLQFCTAAGIPSVLVLPGVDQAGISHEEAVELSAAAMNELAALGAAENVLLLFRVGAGKPIRHAGISARNPALKIATTPTLWRRAISRRTWTSPTPMSICGGLPGLQARWDDGVIDFPAALNCSSAPATAATWRWSMSTIPWTVQVDVMTIRMRDVVRPLQGTL